MNSIYSFGKNISSLLKYIIIFFGLPILIGELIIRILFLIFKGKSIKERSLLLVVCSFAVGFGICLLVPFLNKLVLSQLEGLKAFDFSSFLG